MFNIICSLLSIMFFSIPVLSMDDQKRPRPVDLDALPQAKRTIYNFQIVVNTYYFRDAKRNADELNGVHTGYTPGKKIRL